MGSVSIKSVAKAYGATQVMAGIDVEIADGEFTILVGPSGCGKSTLLRMVAGLETITGGEIAIAGARVNEKEPKDRDIAMVFQNYALYPQMTVAQNMGFALEMQGRPKAEIAAEVAKAAEILSLTPLLQRKPGQLSGGQRQRVAMGRAIVRNPQVFLFDEPLSNLDAKLRVQMRAEIKALHQRLGTTILYVTHDQVEAMTMADKIVVLNAGQIEQVGSPMELYNAPVSPFVAGFIGSPKMNLVPNVMGCATYGIRPEHLDLSTSAGQWQGTIRHVERLGAEVILYLQTEAMGELVLRLPGQSAPPPGSIAYATPQPGRAFQF